MNIKKVKCKSSIYYALIYDKVYDVVYDDKEFDILVVMDERGEEEFFNKRDQDKTFIDVTSEYRSKIIEDILL